MPRHDSKNTTTGRMRGVRRILAILAVLASIGGGVATSTALADEPAKCNTSADKVCYAGYSANGLKTIANDLSVNGKSSKYYAKMHDNLTNDVKGTITLKDGSSLPFRLIGILHDDLADGSGRKAGLTFMAVNAMPKAYCMNGNMPSDNTTTCQENTNRGGWRDSGLRRWMNGGEVWDMFPEAFRTGVSAVLKRSNSMGWGNDSGSAASATSDRLWLVSYRELVPTIYDGWKNYGGFQALNQEGGQYEFFKGRVTDNHFFNAILKNMYQTASGSRPAGLHYSYWGERSSHPYNPSGFLLVDEYGGPAAEYDFLADYRFALVPAFSF